MTVDDGWTRDLDAVAFLRERRWPITMFVVADAVARNPGYFRSLIAAGAVAEDHTEHHEALAGRTADEQRAEICTGAERLTDQLGSAPHLLRPPYGSFDETTRVVAAACGLDTVVGWNATFDNGQLHVIGGRLRPGNIILLHFTDHLGSDLRSLARQLDAQHLRVGSLEESIHANPAAANGASGAATGEATPD